MAASLDRYDHALLAALVEDSTRTNAELSELVKLSPSQCSRRRTRLEADGFITGYGARLDENTMGYALRAITRVTLGTHSAKMDDSFGNFLNAHEEVQSAYSVTGDADYVLIIVTRDLEAFARFIHRELLPHPTVSQVRSEIVLLTLKRG
ncbi:MAG: Lrp/AsnC family transcriptional regulator [Pseudomonadota bacterium]